MVLRALCVGALLLVWAVPVDPQWRVLSNVLSPAFSNDISVPVRELRYPGYIGSARKSTRSAASAAVAKPTEQPPRSRRQYKSTSNKQSTFSLLRQLISETTNETRTAFNQIGDILGSQFADSARPRPTTTTTRAPPSAEQANATSSSSSAADGGGAPSASSTTTTEAPYRISRQELFGILQRNSIGIGRLFRREYDSAMQDSKANLNRFKQEFRLAVAPFLQSATTEATSSTASAGRRRR